MQFKPAYILLFLLSFISFDHRSLITNRVQRAVLGEFYPRINVWRIHDSAHETYSKFRRYNASKQRSKFVRLNFRPSFNRRDQGAVSRKTRNFSGDIILFVSSKRRRLEARNFAVIFIFIPFTTYDKTSFTGQAGRSFTNDFSGPKSSRDFRETGRVVRSRVCATPSLSGIKT